MSTQNVEIDWGGTEVATVIEAVQQQVIPVGTLGPEGPQGPGYVWQMVGEWTAAGTFPGITLPAGTIEARFVLVGVGGAGGSGRRGLTTEVRAGGGGGGGGPLRILEVTDPGILADSFTVVLPAAPNGAPAVTVDNTNGSIGTAGGNATITGVASGLISYAYASLAGGGGGLGVSGVAGGGRQGTHEFTANGGASSAAGVAGAAAGLMNRVPSGGGGGGGLTAANVASAGAIGGYLLGMNMVSTAGAINAAGGAGPVPTALQRRQGLMYGGGGGGGGSSAAGPGGAGGHGAYPGGGGGGGGASSNGQPSGAGGNGGGAYCVIFALVPA